ncbi:hypothetical protein V5799_008591 [Amblyomma americanum]|uniref:N(6)-L-threonylcarbamoyladenine synthase n=1 Tax=Amblyomma americanum TaxID=6943 RepID=A0AAQ4FE83_AMBAM
MLLHAKRQEYCRKYCTSARSVILGIETSCDDTAVGIVDDSGNILGEAAHSQLAIHIEYGGIIPPIARDMHKENIARVTEDALRHCAVPIEEMTAIAVTNRPGMSLSLRVGADHAIELARRYCKPLIPVHHMEAHATAVRLQHRQVPLQSASKSCVCQQQGFAGYQVSEYVARKTHLFLL